MLNDLLGANRYASSDVPLNWMRKRATRKACKVGVSDEEDALEIHRLTIEIGVTSFATEGLATAMPPTALVTDTAGVKTPSASVRLVPKRLYEAGK